MPNLPDSSLHLQRLPSTTMAHQSIRASRSRLWSPAVQPGRKESGGAAHVAAWLSEAASFFTGEFKRTGFRGGSTGIATSTAHGN
jgi:hypothetical protein